MHVTTLRRTITTLAAATVVAACDRPADEAAAPAPRALVDAPKLACLADTKLVLHHTDDTTEVTTDLEVGLATQVRPGDEVELSFAVTEECAVKYGPRVTLAAHTAVSDRPLHLLQDAPSPAYDVHTARLDGGPQLLHVRVPDCAHTLDLAFGEPIPVQSGPRRTYAAEQRLIAGSLQTGVACDEPPLQVERFDPVERGWGDAPVAAHFGWQIAADPAAPLRCELDLDGDGAPDELLDPCPHGTDEIKTDALPLREYPVGKHRPELVVHADGRRIWAATNIYSNRLDYKPGVRFLEQHPGFLSAEVTANPAPDPTKVTLHYAGLKNTPHVTPGQIVVGHGGPQGYMLRVETATKLGTTVELTGQPALLEEVLAGGFYGVRDHYTAMDDARCVEGACMDAEITPVDEFPPAPGAPAPAAKPLALDGPDPVLDGSRGVRVVIPLPNNVGDVRFFGGVLVKSFEIDFDWFSIPNAAIDITPAVEATINLKSGVKKLFELGKLTLGPLPTPIPLVAAVDLRVKAEASMKLTAKGRIKMPGYARKDGQGWQMNFDPQADASLSLLESGGSLGGEIKLTAMPAIVISLGLLTGPYFTPTLAIGARQQWFAPCETCNTIFSEFGAMFGWNKPWRSSDPLFTPISFLFAEQELKKQCTSGTGPCVPPGDPPGGGGDDDDDGHGGGSSGDVHIVSHDGLLFDFQAGGEFVLTRAVSGAPFEVQTRQEPLGPVQSVSVNTAVATRVGPHRVGFYTRRSTLVHVDGAPVDLAPGASLDLEGGVLTRTDLLHYELAYAGGEVLRVLRHGGLLSARVQLPPSRAGEVVGLLGDADGDPGDDVALGPDVFLAQPVSEQLLYRGDDSFAAAWRVDPAASLFDYDVGTSAATYRAAPYIDMPSGSPPFQLPHAGLADQLCVDCPADLRDACRLDVGLTGDPAVATQCLEMADPTTVMYPADGPTIVSPRHGAPLDCSGDGHESMIFRAPGAAEAGPGVGPAYTLSVEVYDNYEHDWHGTSVHTGSPLGEYSLECAPIGGGWGECVFSFPDDICTLYDGSRWTQHAWSVTADVPPQVGAATSYASFTVP
ncbi:MAG: VWD domain-containing protein [Myxococcales bacterium]|nr:VWD domain-containing protein [Myxococcales bacterium]